VRVKVCGIWRARGQLRGQIPELRGALEGHLTEHHRYLLGLLWEELSNTENCGARVETPSRNCPACRPVASAG
jgi:hypothetical protein